MYARQPAVLHGNTALTGRRRADKSNKSFDVVERHTIDALYSLANISQQLGERFMDELTLRWARRGHSAAVTHGHPCAAG